MGIFLQVVMITDSQIEVGRTVDINVEITNVSPNPLYVMATAQVKTQELFPRTWELLFNNEIKPLSPGSTGVFYQGFPMPDKDVLVTYAGWYENASGVFIKDDEWSQYIVSIPLPVATFSNLSASYQRG